MEFQLVEAGQIQAGLEAIQFNSRERCYWVENVHIFTHKRMKSSLRITNNGNTIRAKGAAAQALFDTLTKKPDLQPISFPDRTTGLVQPHALTQPLEAGSLTSGYVVRSAPKPDGRSHKPDSPVVNAAGNKNR